MKYILSCITVLLLFSACGTESESGLYKFGKIEYKITYLENNLQNISPSLLPKRMKLEFDQEHSVNLIEGFMGIFKLNNIINYKHKRSSTVLEVLNKNYIYNGKKGDEMCCFDSMRGMKVKHTDETKIIAGLNCKKAIVELPETEEIFEVYYTTDISLSNPNITNPYEDIDGVLMDFQLSMSGMKMKFTAEKFQQMENLAVNVNLPVNSSEVTREQMTQIMNKLME